MKDDRPGCSLTVMVVVSVCIFMICIMLIEAMQPNPDLYPAF